MSAFSDNALAIQAQGLKRRLGSKEVLSGLDLAVPRGTVFGLLGANGAGKTTTIRILLGLIRSDEGESTILGEDSRSLSRECRQRIGYLSEGGLPWSSLDLTALLRFVSSFYRSWDWAWCEELQRRFDLPADQVLSEMSVGQRRKAELLVTLAPRPDVIVLDDPAFGLDSHVRRDVLWATLASARDQGKTVLFTSHIMQDVERVADAVGFLVGGRLIHAMRLADLFARFRRISLQLARGDDGAAVHIAGEVSRSLAGDTLFIVTSSFDMHTEREARRQGRNVQINAMNLEDIFCAVTGT